MSIVVSSAFIAGFSAAWLAMGFSHDSQAKKPTGQPVAIVISPDKAYMARIWLPTLDGLGATISQTHQVWLEGRSGESRMMLVADKTDQIKLKWLAARLLEVCYSDAQISGFRNRFVDINRTDSETLIQTVEVWLRRVERINDC
jgi:hypothetical protein